MERSRRPSLALQVLNRIAITLVGTLGLAPAGVMVLYVPGRVSGRMRGVALRVLVHQGAYHLVSLYGESDWLRNLRTAGRASLVRGRTVVPVEVGEELSIEQRVMVIHTYILRWDGQIVGVPGLDRTATADEVAAVAEHIPVIRLKLSS
ncbi:MAG: nitroreductase/quinone reductase family protein [Thermomicrobiales bacterium]